MYQPSLEFNIAFGFLGNELTSRMLHAHPHSLSTDQKNLEVPEMLLFLKYVEMQFCWIRKMALGYLGHTDLH